MKVDGRGLRISLVSRHIVFRADRADLSARGAEVLDALAPLLRDLPNQIDIAGHTNQVKVKPKFYPTDWELSAARAVTVLRYLHERQDMPARNMSAVAYGTSGRWSTPEAGVAGAEQAGRHRGAVLRERRRAGAVLRRPEGRRENDEE